MQSTSAGRYISHGREHVQMQAVMVEPVIAADGHTYERAAMQHWLQHHPTSPVTQALLPHTRLVPNLLIKGAIASQRQQLSQAAHELQH